MYTHDLFDLQQEWEAWLAPSINRFVQLWRCETRISGAATDSRPVFTKATAETDFNHEPSRQPRPATSTTDATQLEAPQAASVFRRGRRRRRFCQGSKVVSWARAHGRPCSRRLASRRAGGSGQAGNAVHGSRRNQHPWQNLRHPGAAVGRTSRLLHPCWGVLQAPAGAHRVGGGVRFQLSSPLGENQCCPGGHPLPDHAAGHLCRWASSCL